MNNWLTSYIWWSSIYNTIQTQLKLNQPWIIKDKNVVHKLIHHCSSTYKALAKLPSSQNQRTIIKYFNHQAIK